MGKINIGRVLLGGVVAGIVGDILGYLVDGVMLAPRWAFAQKQLGKPEFSVNQMVMFNAIGLVYRILTIWLYAAMRPRFGAGLKTAVYAGLAAWVIGSLLPNAGFWVAGMLPRGLTVFTTAGAIIELTVAALAGAALYKKRGRRHGGPAEQSGSRLSGRGKATNKLVLDASGSRSTSAAGVRGA
jgi:hypothetical protein